MPLHDKTDGRHKICCRKGHKLYKKQTKRKTAQLTAYFRIQYTHTIARYGFPYNAQQVKKAHVYRQTKTVRNADVTSVNSPVVSGSWKRNALLIFRINGYIPVTGGVTQPSSCPRENTVSVGQNTILYLHIKMHIFGFPPRGL